MRKQLILVASLLLCSATVVVAQTNKTERTEKKSLIDCAKAHEVTLFRIQPLVEVACVDHCPVAIPGGDLYHVESLVSLQDGFKPAVTATIRGPTI